MSRRQVERRLTEVGRRIRELREELRVADEQLVHLADAADDARLRSLVSETPVSDREHREAARHAEQESNQVLFPDDLLPGVRSEGISLKKGLAMGGGAATFVVLAILNSLDELQMAAISVLAPDIRDTFGVSDGTITFIASSSGAFVVLGAIPMGWAADRFKRIPIIGWSSIIFGAMVAMSGWAVNAFAFFWARFGVGIAKANTIPVHSSVIADTYPIGIRGRIGAIDKGTGRLLAVTSPILVGAIAAVAGGQGRGRLAEQRGWRRRQEPRGRRRGPKHERYDRPIETVR